MQKGTGGHRLQVLGGDSLWPCSACPPNRRQTRQTRGRVGPEPFRGGEVRGLEKFWSLVLLPQGDGCWGWRGSVAGNGYASLSVDGERVYAHRFAYVMTFGEIPEGLEIDHLCRNRWCVRPSHLEAVTHRENVRRSPVALAAINARKERCLRGHWFSSINRDGSRRCRECMAMLQHRWYVKHRRTATESTKTRRRSGSPRALLTEDSFASNAKSQQQS